MDSVNRLFGREIKVINFDVRREVINVILKELKLNSLEVVVESKNCFSF